MSLPRIQNADYYAFKDSILHRSVYTILWGASYTYRWDYGLGGHPGVDIASAKGTPVRAIGNGEVTVAGWRGDRGNTVIIAHDRNEEVFYSIYTHMDSVETFAGAKVSEGTLIGRIGDTGNAFGNHLHFQIDRNTRIRHPFFYPGCI
jgi:murein DD-endopeptidase MepM/ murein hydrolase activator NlpD